jgi:hypothetical protein
MFWTTQLTRYRFTATNHELIILYLSHTLDTDNNYVPLSQDQWNKLFDQLKGLNNRYTNPSPPQDLTDLKLSDLLPSNQASVLVVAELPSGISLGDYATQGFYSSSNFPHFDSYANSDDANTMENDQISKLQQNRNIVASDSDRKDSFHVFSWTLTQSNPFGEAIVNMAVSVWDDLFGKAYAAFTPESFPNVLYMDAYAARDKSVDITTVDDSGPKSVPGYPDVAALAMAVNNGLAARNNYVMGKS